MYSSSALTLTRDSANSVSCPHPFGARFSYHHATSPRNPKRPSPINMNVPSRANRTKSANPHSANIGSIRRTAAGQGGLGNPARVGRFLCAIRRICAGMYIVFVRFSLCNNRPLFFRQSSPSSAPPAPFATGAHAMNVKNT